MTYGGRDADLVYSMTRAMVELFADYKDGAPGNTGWDLKRQVFDWVDPVPRRRDPYFKEKGVWTPASRSTMTGSSSGRTCWPRPGPAYAKAARDDEKAFAQGWMKARAAALTQAGFDPVVTE